MVAAAMLMVIGSAIRCVPLQLDAEALVNKNDLFITIAAHVCGILNGIAGIAMQVAPPVISSVWFPPKVSFPKYIQIHLVKYIYFRKELLPLEWDKPLVFCVFHLPTF